MLMAVPRWSAIRFARPQTDTRLQPRSFPSVYYGILARSRDALRFPPIVARNPVLGA
jgi:hypothetical protein